MDFWLIWKSSYPYMFHLYKRSVLLSSSFFGQVKKLLISIDKYVESRQLLLLFASKLRRVVDLFIYDDRQLVWNNAAMDWPQLRPANSHLLLSFIARQLVYFCIFKNIFIVSYCFYSNLRILNFTFLMKGINIIFCTKMKKM